jgi:hypothetical protein
MNINFLMTIFSRISIFVALVVISSCDDKEQVLDDGLYTVSGHLRNESGALKNVEVNLNDMIQYTATSDNSGLFEIKNVPGGSYTLNSTILQPDGSFSALSEEIVVSGDLFLEALKLPDPVMINNLSTTIEGDENVVNLVWGRYRKSDFREYKVYQHSTSGLDETTGTLIHVATLPGDTTFSIRIPHNQKNYFRVFVLDEFNLIGGSNILEVDTSFPFEPELIPGDQMKTYYTKEGLVHNFFFNAVEGGFYAIAWNYSGLIHNEINEYTGAVTVKATRENSDVDYFDFKGWVQFKSSPYPIRAVASEKVRIEATGIMNDFGATEGSYGLQVQLLDNPIPLSIGTETILNVKANKTIIASFDAEANSTYHISSVSKRVFAWYPSEWGNPSGIGMGISIYAGNQPEPIFYRVSAKCCGPVTPWGSPHVGSDERDVTITEAGKVYVIVGGDIETWFGHNDNDLGITVTKL